MSENSNVMVLAGKTPPAKQSGVQEIVFAEGTVVKIEKGWAKVRLFGLPHLVFKLEDFIAMQSWQNDGLWHIEIMVRTGNGGSATVHTTYDAAFKWNAILGKLSATLDSYL